MAIAPDDPNIVWVGTGEANNRQSSSWGDGIYKSTEAKVDSVAAALDTLRCRVVGGGFGQGGGGGGAALRGRVTQLKGGVMSSTSLPTEVQMRQLGELRAAVPKAVDDVNALVARFSAMLEDLARRGIYPTRPKPVGAG